jgi:hypothetical protein
MLKGTNYGKLGNSFHLVPKDPSIGLEHCGGSDIDFRAWVVVLI